MATEQKLSGRTIAHGSAVGHAYVDALPTVYSGTLLDIAAVPAEVARLEQAITKVGHNLEALVRESHEPREEELAQILEAQRMILDDQHFIGGIIARIEKDRLTAERAVEQSFCTVATRLAGVADPYLRGRAEDLREICYALQSMLLGTWQESAAAGDSPHGLIFVTPHLHVSGVLRARRAKAVGFVTSSTAFLSHGGLLLRASGIPALGGVPFNEAGITPGMRLFIDATRGELLLRPSEASIARWHMAPVPARVIVAGAQLEPPLPCATKDGVTVKLWANIDAPDKVERCLEHRLVGVGLFRTELIAFGQREQLTEERQVEIYRGVVQKLHGRPIVFRTFDLGGDKIPHSLGREAATNPALGLRGIRRHLLAEPQELCTQLRAILRATHDVTAAILLPMVTTPSDVQRARAHIDAVLRELAQSGTPHNHQPKLGLMLETPAAALHLKELLAACDFLCVGTNDMSQYLAAADRNNAELASYLAPEQSGLYRLLSMVMSEARALGRQSDIGVGGELANDPAVVSRLITLGFHDFVVNPRLAHVIRAAVSETTAQPQPAS